MSLEVAHCLEFQATQSKYKPIPHGIQSKSWETVGVEIYMLDNKIYWCIVDYQSKFSVMNLAYGLSADILKNKKNM